MFIAIGTSRKQSRYDNREVTWEDFVEIFNDHRMATQETYATFMSGDKDWQTEVKDIGGFVGGKLKHGSRKQVMQRDLLTLDLDYAANDFTEVWELGYDGVQSIIHSTHKHCTANPRLRLIVPLSRPVTPVEYEAIGRRLAQHLGIEQFDRTTYDPGRMMFWQSWSIDAEVVYKAYDGVPLDADVLLHEYADPSDRSQWPRAEREDTELRERAKQMQDPRTKTGVIGQFCRTYNIHEAIAAFLSDVYERCGDMERYTYTGGSTKGGMVVFDNGLFSYSYHDHDPTCGRECNAFDLVRVHKFGQMDKGATWHKQTDKPSYKAMVELAANDARVQETAGEERLADFSDVDVEDKERFELELKETEAHLFDRTRDGGYRLTVVNIEAMFKYHPMLKDILAFDEFKQRVVLKTERTYWRKVNPWDNDIKDSDDAEIRRVFERYGMIGKDRIYDAVTIEAHKHSFHPVRDYLKKLVWDGRGRIETVLIDYFGGADNDYNRFISKLFFKAAVMRVFKPGCKFDTMLTLKGKQGCGKSTFCRILGGDWYSEDSKDLRSKDAIEGLQGVWIHEFSEMSAMKRADAELIKSFLSTSTDRFRAAYGRRTGNYPRQCVFVATTNEIGFLYDKTGNRRFLIFEVPKNVAPTKDVFTDLANERDQLWAEAYAKVKAEGFRTCLALPREIEATACEIQRGFMQDDPTADAIERYLEILLPEDWDDRDIKDRKEYIQHAMKDELTDNERLNAVVRRDRVCAAEIWAEALVHSDVIGLTWRDAQNINRILDNLPDWERIKNEKGLLNPVRFSKYGQQRGFKRCSSL